MAHRIIMPKQGLQMTKGTITQWLKNEGEFVKEGDPLFEMETDKLTITIDAAVSGTLLKILREEGDTVPITDIIAIVGEPGEDIKSLLKEFDSSAAKEEFVGEDIRPTAVADKNVRKRIFATPRAKKRASERQIFIENVKGTGPDGLINEKDVLTFKVNEFRATPVARKLAEMNGIVLSSVDGSGVNGKIMKSDVVMCCAGGNGAEISNISSDHKETVTTIPFIGMRKAIATNMMASLHTMAQANHRMKVDMTESVRLRERLKGAGKKVSYTDILIRVVSNALLKYPKMNACVESDKIVCRHYVNIGIAVALENGLLVPNIKDAHTMSVVQIHEAAAVLADKARVGKLVRDEYSNGTFTITNLGMYEVDEFTPIINPPEVGILGVGAIVDTPCAVDGKVEIRPVMMLSLTYDHRVIDGAPAAEFLQYIKILLQNPYLML
ncbi:dihydrolipoamide acetyltransferase family protein [Robinsoniella sp. KNHs210]|uniref:dihydrolipoamide acetyltransferase family protein n=1 Tax=Robinsoniella sp. KNHs210 TaxID=1469950 RepID=UPI000482A96F|nr:dihydrolipoamide acetyltransferase family protein [Robinsoniella sp. KNHs210]